MAGVTGIIRNLSLPLGMPQLPPSLPRNMVMPFPANSIIGNSNIRFPTPPAASDSQQTAAAPADEAGSDPEAGGSVPSPAPRLTVIGGNRAGLPTQNTERLLDVLRGWRTSLAAAGDLSGPSGSPVPAPSAGLSTEEVGSPGSPWHNLDCPVPSVCAGVLFIRGS